PTTTETTTTETTTTGSTTTGSTTARPTISQTDPLALLRAAGVGAFSPSIAPFCVTPTDDNPLGLATAGAGGVSGPWPILTDASNALDNLAQSLGMAPVTLPNFADSDETAFAFVPSVTLTGTKVQVAWFNTTTLRGGFADLTALPHAQKTLLTTLAPGLGGIRLAKVDTGAGSVLAAVYGSGYNGSRTCYFLPAVGVVENS
ncbi:MAG: hypothetical protein QM662_05800, partial [Gordonia sp. (in: high G+C Gram-positive bacteria)]